MESGDSADVNDGSPGISRYLAYPQNAPQTHENPGSPAHNRAILSFVLCPHLLSHARSLCNCSCYQRFTIRLSDARSGTIWERFSRYSTFQTGCAHTGPLPCCGIGKSPGLWFRLCQSGRKALLGDVDQPSPPKRTGPIVMGKLRPLFASDFVVHSLRHTMLNRLGNREWMHSPSCASQVTAAL